MNLFRKELRALFPFLVLVLLIHCADVLYEPLTERLDEKRWSTGYEPGNGTSAALVLLILGLIGGYSLYPREHDDGTIGFLESLPVSRTRIFLAKVAAAATILVFGSVVGMLTGWLLQLPNTTSMTGHHFRLQVAASATFLYASYSLIVLCHGLLLSFLRRFGLVVYGIAAWVVIALKEIWPGFGRLDMTRICDLEYDGQDVVIDGSTLGLHAGIALGALLVAWFLWTGPAARFAAWFADLAADFWGKILLGCGTAAIVFLAFALMVFMAARSQRERGQPVERETSYRSFENASVETEHFKFTYPVSLRERALFLVSGAEESYASVASAVGAKPGAPIVADLTDRSHEHAGIAKWQKIKIDLESEKTEQRLRHVFHHETAHAFQFQESRDRVERNFQSAQFFVEGQAEWIAFETVQNPAMRAASRRLALAAIKRHRIKFDELCDARGFSAKHDKNLVYPVGETWVEAVARSCGRDAPGKLLRSIGREGAPRGLSPLEFWQDTLQATGFELETVVAEWTRLVALLERDEKPFLEALPRLTGGIVAHNEGWIVLRARLDRAPIEGSRYWARVRDAESVGDVGTSSVRGEVQNEFTIDFNVPRAVLNGRRFQFQLGVQFDESVLPYFEDWQSASVP